MATDPARPDDSDPALDPTEGGYAFADPEPPARPPVSLPPTDDAPARDQHEMSLDEETQPRRRRKRRRHADGDEDEPGVEEAEEPGERILRREDVQAPANWWVAPAVLFA